MMMQQSEVERYAGEYDSSLKVGRQIGYGGTAAVFDLPGTTPAQVLKVMDTRCQPGAEGNGFFALSRRKAMRDYFLNEIRVLEELKGCKYVVPILGTYEYVDPAERKVWQESRSYSSVFLIKMRKLQTLEAYIGSFGLSEDMAVHMAMDICRALQACEENHILHRDVKPDNIFVSWDKEQNYFVLGDFGYCRRMEGLEWMRSVTRCGTPDFTAPEIERRQPLRGSFNSDIFSLGATLYFLLSNGKFPFWNDKDGEEELEDLDGISLEFVRIIRKAVQFRPEDRFQHASEMLSELKKIKSYGHRRNIGGHFFISAKQEMLKGNFKEALWYAARGSEKGEKGCRRLLAYCLYHEYGFCEDRDSQANMAQKAIRILDDLAEEGDSVAKCIRATIHFNNDEWDAFFAKVRESAREGCAIAQYLYGRALYEEWRGFCGYQDLGRKYVQNAAQKNYLAALRYLKRIIKNEPEICVPSEIARLLENTNLEDKERLKSDIIRFL